ncbi:MAG TPA: FtsX-like permease family protein, partial [Streptosporangiaceae bacterium]
EHRRDEFAVMRARGASQRQIARLALRAGAVVAVPAAAAGAALAAGLTPGDSEPLGWWLAGLTLLAALAWPPLLAFRSHAVGSAGRQRPDREASRRDAARRLVAEATLIAAAVGGLVVLTRQGLPASGHSDLYTSAVPVLIAIPVAILIMRCYPVVIRLLLRLAGFRPGVTAFMGLARAARTPAGAMLPAFALILTLAVVAFGAMVNAAVRRGEVAASWQRTGADAVIDASGSPRQLTPALLRRISALPGVTRTAGVFITSGTMPGGQVLGVAVVNPASYAALTAGTPQPAFPAAELARPSRPGQAVPVLGTGFAIAVAGHGATPLAGGLGKLTIRIVARTPSIPGATGPYIVVPAWALGPTPPAPTTLLVIGPHLDGRALLATVRHALPGANVTLRSQVLAGLTGAPLPHGADTAFIEGTAAAAGFSLLILLITLVLSARSREFTLARLRVMGLGQGQARWLAAVETLPQVLAAVAGGAVAGWAVALLLGPAIDLSAFTGSGAGVPIRVEPLPLAIASGALLVLAMIALAGQVMIADRQGRARALRVAE